MLILSSELQASLSQFAEIMALKGEIFRAMDGRRTQRVDINQQAYFIKQHFGVGWKEILKNLLQFRLPVINAKNEWLALQELAQAGIFVPRIAGFGMQGKNPAKQQSFLITRALPHHISLEHLCRDWKKNPPDFAFKQKLLMQVADIARIMHTKGINHRDFYICHFLLDLTTEIGQANKIYLIDLHRAQIRRRIPLRWIIKDLAGLYFSSKEIGLTGRDLLRFIKKYRNKSLRDVLAKEKHFWLKVKKRGDKLYRKHEYY